MQGVSGSSSKSASSASAFGSNQLFTVEQSGQASTNNNFTLRAKALVVREGFDRPAPEQAPRQIDPSMLARIALEEELKKKGGGGGGGSAPSFNPNMWVSYSYKLMNDALQQLYALLNQILDQSTAQSSSAVANLATQVGSSVKSSFSALTSPLKNIFQNTNNQMRDNSARSPLSDAMKKFADPVQFANILFSSLVSSLKKAIYGSDDDTKTNTQEQTEREELANLNMMSAIADEDNEANGKSIKSHMDNIARQYSNWANSFKD
jgi:hypothetical protein